MFMTFNARLALLLTCLLLVPSLVAPAQTQDRARQLTVVADEETPPTPQARRNAGRFFDKLRAGRAVTVAYIGGSLTAGAGASNAEKTSYRALTNDWLRRTFPKVKFTELNAAVAGTGSLYATLRARRDVIADKPDLVFVEFAASDALEATANDETIIKKSVEGLLRQLLAVPQPPEVVMLYAATPKRETRAAWHDAVAAHYGVPSLNLAEQTWAAIDAGRIKAADLLPADARKDSSTTKDPLALSDTGHKLYAETITAFLAEQQGMRATPLMRTLPPPLVSDELNYGELKPIAEIKHDPTWRAETSGDHNFPAALLTTNKPGAQIEYYFEGTVLGLTFRAGPDGGTIECLIDGKPAPAPLARIDCYDTTTRLTTRILAGGLGPGEHKLTLRVIPDKHAKSSGNNVRLGYLLVGGTRPERL